MSITLTELLSARQYVQKKLFSLINCDYGLHLETAVAQRHGVSLKT